MRLCTICAREGSKGVPGKNVRPLLGRPLITHTIEQANRSGLFDAIVVSSDDQRTLDIASEAGVDLAITRPKNLASDEAGKVGAIVHGVHEAERHWGVSFQTIVDLDVTSPLRLAGDIVSAVELLEESLATNVISGCRSRRSPYFNLVELDANGHARLSKQLPEGVLRRQDAPISYDMNASIYVWRRDEFLADPGVFYERTLLYEMPEERSVDIDSELDWSIVEMIAEGRDGHD